MYRWGFQICDVRSTGRISRAEVTALIRLMFGVLTGLELDPNNPSVGDLVSSLFAADASNAKHDPPSRPPPQAARSAPPSPVRKGAAVGGGAGGGGDEEVGGTLTWDQYRSVCLASAHVMTAVPSPEVYRKGYYGDKLAAGGARGTILASGGLAQRLGQVVMLTQRKCDFILTLMLGLQTAIEPDLARQRQRDAARADAAHAVADKDAASPLAAFGGILRSFVGASPSPCPVAGEDAGAAGGGEGRWTRDEGWK